MREELVKIANSRNVTLSDMVEYGFVVTKFNHQVDEMLSISKIILDYGKPSRDFNFSKIDNLVKSYSGWPPMHYYNNHTPEPIVAAAMINNSHIFDYLLENKMYRGFSNNENGNMLLRIANISIPFAMRLLNFNFDVNSTNKDGENILHQFIQNVVMGYYRTHGDDELISSIKQPISNGINVNRQNIDGYTPLHMAVNMIDIKNKDIMLRFIELLVNHDDIDISILNHNKDTVLDLVRRMEKFKEEIKEIINNRYPMSV